ncbi:MAG TPA: glycosyltransferase family 2 protein [Dehalococcoidia bacterium]|nr:glycosyltransferase family 2 protein [Dehalococcoidia bacterium]
MAVLIPCYNEAMSVQKVVSDFKEVLPGASVYVYDNNSTDATADLAVAAGANLRHEPLQGKGNVVRRMFADIEADVYVLVDGDDTYDASTAPKMIHMLAANDLDMVTGVRVTDSPSAYRPGHTFGKNLFAFLLARIFDRAVKDVFSGYRVFSRRFVKSFPALSSGFEIETELTLHALELGMKFAEIETPYRPRPPGSTSKLRTFRDGFRVFRTLALFFKEERPLLFFGTISFCLAALSVLLAIPVVKDYLETGLVPRLPSAVLASAIMLVAFLSLTAGIILDTVTRGRHELKRLFYLSLPTLSAHADDEQGGGGRT